MTTITVCTTCRAEAHREDREAVPDGEGFLETMRAAAAAAPGVSVRGTACLMGCSHGCNVAVSDTGKMTYVLGRFDATADDAEAVVAYAGHHRDSGTGVVPFRSWPQGVKGHFVARIPPLDEVPSL